MNFFSEFIDHLKADPDIVVDRYKKCIVCPYLIRATSTCKKCGCFMKIKTKLINSKCPIGKW